MAKEAIKERARKRQDGKSTTGADLPADSNGKLIHPLTDTNRKTPRAEGGIYSDENTDVMLPTEHRDLHGNKPWLNDPELVQLRTIMADYRTCQKLRIKINNHELAVARGMDELTTEISEMFEESLAIIKKREVLFGKLITKQVDKLAHPIVPMLLGIKGVGAIIVAEIMTLIDITKAEYASSLWSFAGYAGPSAERYVKGVKGGGHKYFRTVLFNLGLCLVRVKNEDYTSFYYKRKELTAASERKVMHSRPEKGDNGNNLWIREMTPWKDVNRAHRHQDALRIMTKHFLADLWYVWRTLEGLPTPDLYVKAVMGHSRTVSPFERGWPEIDQDENNES